MTRALVSRKGLAPFLTGILSLLLLGASNALPASAMTPAEQKSFEANRIDAPSFKDYSNYQPYWSVSDTGTKDKDADSFPYGDVLYQDRKGDYHRLENGQYASSEETAIFKSRQDTKPLVEDISLIDEKIFEPQKAYLYDKEYKYGEVAVGGYEAQGSYKVGRTTYTDKYGVTHELYGAKASIEGELNAVKATGHTSEVDLSEWVGLQEGTLTTRATGVVQVGITGKAGGAVGFTDQGLEGHGEIGIDATAKAGFELPTTLNFWGIRTTATIQGDVRAGAAVGAEGEFHVGWDGITFGGKAFAALGLGGGVGGKITIDYSEAVKKIVSAWPEIKRTVVETGEELKEKISDVFYGAAEDNTETRKDPSTGQIIWWKLGYHGYYCGPDWTACQYKSKDAAQWCLSPKDGMDIACRLHDWGYREDDIDVKLIADLILLKDLLNLAETDPNIDINYWKRIWAAFVVKLAAWDLRECTATERANILLDIALIDKAIRDENFHAAKFFYKKLWFDISQTPQNSEGKAKYDKLMEQLVQQYGKNFEKCATEKDKESRYTVDICGICGGQSQKFKTFSCSLCLELKSGECPALPDSGTLPPSPDWPEVINPWNFE